MCRSVSSPHVFLHHRAISSRNFTSLVHKNYFVDKDIEIKTLGKEISKIFDIHTNRLENIKDVYGHFEYYTKRPKSSNHVLLYRCAANDHVKEESKPGELLLDFNELELVLRKPIRLSGLKPSLDADASYLAVMLDVGSSSMLMIKCLRSHKLIKVCLHPFSATVNGNTSPTIVDVEWGSHAEANESSLFLYLTVSLDNLRPSQVYLLQLDKHAIFPTSTDQTAGSNTNGVRANFDTPVSGRSSFRRLKPRVRKQLMIYPCHVSIPESVDTSTTAGEGMNTCQLSCLMDKSLDRKSFLSLHRSKDGGCVLLTSATKKFVESYILEHEHQILCCVRDEWKKTMGCVGEHVVPPLLPFLPAHAPQCGSTTADITDISAVGISSRCDSGGGKTYVEYSAGFFYVVTDQLQGRFDRRSDGELCVLRHACGPVRCPVSVYKRWLVDPHSSSANTSLVPSLIDMDCVYPTNGSNRISIEDYDIFHEAVVLYGRRLQTGTQSVVPTADSEQGGYSCIRSDSSGVSLPSIQVLHLRRNEVHVHDYFDALQSAVKRSGSGTAVQRQREPAVFQLSPSSNLNHKPVDIQLDVSSPILPSLALRLDLKRQRIESAGDDHRLEDEGEDGGEGGGRGGGWARQLLNVIKGTKSSKLTDSDRECDNMVRQWGRQYTVRRVHIPGSDHEPTVPLTLVTPTVDSSIDLDSNCRPCLLVAYGAYGMACSIEFRADLMYLLERGWIIAYAHVRGGNECGSAWHREGRLLSKWNSFTDYARCATFLKENGYCSHLCGEGTSAGGLVMGVMATVPEYRSLFTALVLRSPFLNVLGVMEQAKSSARGTDRGTDRGTAEVSAGELGGEDLLGEHEIDEWGDVSDLKRYVTDALPAHARVLLPVDRDSVRDGVTYREYIASYCPMAAALRADTDTQLERERLDSCSRTNISHVHHPSIFVSVGSEDNKVSATDALEWLKNVQQKATTNDISSANLELMGPVFCFSECENGTHNGPVVISEQVVEMAKQVAFLERVIRLPGSSC